MYSYFLLVTSGMAAAMRLLATRRLAWVNAQRLLPEKRRQRYRWTGIAVMLGSLLLLPLYFFFKRDQAWIPLAAAVGVFSGAEFVANALEHAEPKLLRQNRIFGALYALATFLVYFLVLR